MGTQNADNAQETTLDLDSIMAEGMDVYEGEPLKTEGEAREQAPITQPPAAVISPPEMEMPAEAGQAETEETPAPEIPEADQTAEDDKPPAESKPKTRFKDHEAAEQGYRHLQAELTRTAQARKDLERKLQELEQAKEAGARAQEREQAFYDYSKQRNQQALEAIAALSDEDPDYQDRVSAVWAEKDRDIFKKQQELSAPIRQEAPAQPQEETPAQAETPEDQAQNPVENDREQVLSYVAEQAKEAGIDPEDAHFRLVCQATPTVDEAGKAMTLDEQIQWAVGRTKAYREQLLTEAQKRQREAAAKKTAQAQSRDLPLGRTGTSPAPKSADAMRPVTLDDALSAAMETRRL